MDPQNYQPQGQPAQPMMQQPAAIDPHKYTFKFLSYYFNKDDRVATFCYQGLDNFIFTEQIIFAPNPDPSKVFNPTNNLQLEKLLDRAVFLAFILSGTSYYKAHPTPYIRLDLPIDEFQASFFSHVYQEGLSQFAFENKLTRNNLAHFYATPNYIAPDPVTNEFKGDGILALESGGKDSLLVATKLVEHNIDFTPWYISSSYTKSHPAVIDNLFNSLEHKNASICVRHLDLDHLEQSQGLNGHVPVTYIVESLALIQAIIDGDSDVITSIAREGEEPHAMIGDLPVNHQWSKTWEAEQLLSQYVARYLSPKLHIGSPIRHMSELRVAKEFIDSCWIKYGYQFSSCNRANYQQGLDNKTLKWCGECAKCANSYLLFCPFLAPQQLQSLFQDQDLFKKPELTEIFMGLLGVNGHMKPFECIGSVEELRTAYHNRMKVDKIPVPQVVYAKPPIEIPPADTVNALSQASERLGIKKMLSGQQQVQVRQINAQTENQQNGEPVEMYQPLYADLPFPVPAANFDWMHDFPCDEYFKKFFETHKDYAAKKQKEKQAAEELAQKLRAKRKDLEADFRERYMLRPTDRNKRR